MARSILYAALTLGVAVLSGAALAQQPPPTDATAPKQQVIRFFGFQGTREERAALTQTPDYVQHNPRFLRMDAITGARGNQAWVKAGEEAQRRSIQLVALNGIRLRDPIILIGEGDLVHAVYRGDVADPTRPGSTYPAFAFESFRVRGGKFSEHWDQVRLEPGWMNPRPPATPPPPGGRGAGAGRAQQTTIPSPAPEPPAGCTAAPGTIAANKQIAAAFGSEGDERRRALLAADYVDHSPRTVDPPPSPMRTRDHIVAECDFVSVVWKQVLPDPDDASRTWEAFTFDAFRIRGGKIAEHWDGDVK
jgi:predicted SnoaL-like aldol condensation-catalyzing enzyme